MAIRAPRIAGNIAPFYPGAKAIWVPGTHYQTDWTENGWTLTAGSAYQKDVAAGIPGQRFFGSSSQISTASSSIIQNADSIFIWCWSYFYGLPASDVALLANGSDSAGGWSIQLQPWRSSASAPALLVVTTSPGTTQTNAISTQSLPIGEWVWWGGEVHQGAAFIAYWMNGRKITRTSLGSNNSLRASTAGFEIGGRVSTDYITNSLVNRVGIVKFPTETEAQADVIIEAIYELEAPYYRARLPIVFAPSAAAVNLIAQAML